MWTGRDIIHSHPRYLAYLDMDLWMRPALSFFLFKESLNYLLDELGFR